MISHSHKFIYVRIGKTASTSVARFLRQYGGCEKNAHNPIMREIQRHGIKQPDDYFKFTIVRNPWSRFVSYYNMLKLQKKIQTSFESYVLHTYDIPKNSEGRRAKGKGIELLAKQLPYLMKDGEVYIDYIGRFEQLQESVDHIMIKINEKPERLPYARPWFSSPKNKHYTEYYNDETREIVGTMFQEDVEYFKYKFDD